MATIAATILNDNRLILGNEEYGRTMTIGTHWGKIRIGLRYAIQTDAASNIANTQFVVGVSQGTTAMYKNGSCTDFIGFSFGQTLDNSTFTLAAGPPTYYSIGASVREGYLVSNVAGSKTTVNASTSTVYLPGSPTGFLGWNFLDIQKLGASGVSVTIWRNTTATDVQVGRSLDAFNKAMENEGTPGGSLTALPMTLAAYAGNFAWDTLDIAWNKSGPFFLEIGTLAVTRFE